MDVEIALRDVNGFLAAMGGISLGWGTSSMTPMPAQGQPVLGMPRLALVRGHGDGHHHRPVKVVPVGDRVAELTADWGDVQGWIRGQLEVAGHR